MTQQYLRSASLVVGAASGDGLDVSALRFTFSIQHSTIQTPRAGWFRIYNAAPATAAKVQSEFTRVALSAGYMGNAATIFDGTIRQVRIGRESPTDTFIDIFAAVGDEPYNQAVVNVSLTKGWTDADVLSACLKALQPYGISAGNMPTLNSNAAVRGVALYGSVKEVLRLLAARNGCSWNLDQNKLNLIPIGKPLSGAQAIVLNSQSGMIGIPCQTIDGVEVTCLLNPQIRPGSMIRINESDIIKAQQNLSYTGQAQNSLLPTVSSDGAYAVQWIDFEGDSRGDAWYSHMVCTSTDANATPASSAAFLENTDS